MKVCGFEPCEREAKAKGLCGAHYQQKWAGKELKPIEERRFLDAPAPGLKVCTKCLQAKDKATEFYQRKNGMATSRCKKCMIVLNSEYNRLRAERNRAGVTA